MCFKVNTLDTHENVSTLISAPQDGSLNSVLKEREVTCGKSWEEKPV